MTNLLRSVMGMLFLACSIGLYAQAGSYSFSYSNNNTFNYLSSSATQVPNLHSDSGEDDVPIGFNFEFEGVTYDTVAATSDGFLSFIVGATSTLSNDLDNGSATRRPLVAPLWDDHDGRANTSAASYEVTGTAPNRVFTFEWRDWEWSWNSTDSVVSFQVELHETTNEIHFNYQWECESCKTGPDASIGISGGSTFLSVTDISTGTSTASNSAENSTIDSIVSGHRYSFVPPACPGPSFTSVNKLTTDSIIFSFSGTSGNYQVEWGPAGFTQGTSSTNISSTTNTIDTIAGLQAGTTYDIYIRSICSTANSPWSGPFPVTTVYTPPYLEDFAGGYPGLDYTEGDGAIANPTVFTSTTSSSWVDGGFNNNGTGTGSAKLNLYGTTPREWFFGPSIDLGDGSTTYQVEFDAGLVPWLGTGPSSLGSDDTVKVVVSLDNGQTWNDSNTVLSLSNSNTISNGLGTHFVASLSGYSGVVKIGFYAESTASNADNDLFIDNIQVRQPPLCPDPLGLVILNNEADSLVVAWSSSASSFNVSYGSSPLSNPGVGGTNIATTDTFVVINSLAFNSAYEIYVQADCSAGTGGTSSYAGPVNVITPCQSVAMPYLENFDTWPLSCWDSTGSSFYWVPFTGSGTDRYAEASFWSNSSGTALLSSRPITISQDAQVRFYWSHSYSSSYPNDQLVVRAQVTGTSQWDTILNLNGSAFDDPSAGNTAPGNFVEEIILLDPTTYTGNDVIFELHGIADFGPDLFINDFNIEAIPSCPKMQNLTDSLTTAFETSLFWDDVSGSATSYEVWVGPSGFYQGTNITAGFKTIVSSDSLFIDTLSELTCYEFLVRGICGPGDTSDWQGPVIFCTPPSCPAPNSLGFIGATLNTANVYWTSGGSSDFNVEFGPTGYTQGGGTIQNFTNDTVNITGLSAGTTYDFYVRDSCGQGDVSVWSGPFTFTTAYGTNFLEDFDNNTFSSPGWIEADGQLTTNTQFTSTSSSWAFDDFANDAAKSRAQRVNIWLGNQYEWFISPSIYLDPSIPNLQAEFDAAVTAYNSSGQGIFGSDDSLALVISTDNGLTWSTNDILWVKTGSDLVDSSGEHVIVPLSGYSGYVQFGFYAGSTVNDPEDNEFFIDNFEVRTPPSCANPTNISVSGVTQTSANVRWTPADSNGLGWQVILTTAGQAPANGSVYVATTIDSLAITGLTASTSYCAYVVEQCASGYSDTIGPVCFSTQCSAFTAPYFEDFETGGFCWSNEYVIGSNDWTMAAGSSGGSISTAYGGSFNAQFTSSGTPVEVTRFVSPVIDISGLSNPQLSFWYGQEDWAGDQNITRVYYRDGQSQPWNLIWSDSSSVAAWTKDSLIIPSNSTTLQIAFEGEDNWGRANVIDDVRIIEAACPAPGAISLSGANCDTLTVSWNSISGGSIIQYGPAGFAPGTGTFTGIVASPYSISGLMLDADYDVWVADTCQGDTTSYSGPFTLHTDSVGILHASFTASVGSVTLIDAVGSFDASASTNAVSYDWDFGNGNTATGVNATETFTANGSYNVELTVTDRCGNTDDTTVVVTVAGISLEETAVSKAMEVYPNPNRGEFTVMVPNMGAAEYTIQIADMTGKVLFTQDEFQSGVANTLKVEGFAEGIYLLRVKGEGFTALRRISIKQ